MCGRYYRRSDKQRLAEAFRLGKLTDLPLEVAPSFNIAPTTMQPVIISDRDTGERLKNDQPIAFGGVWEHWKAPEGALEWDTFSILTTDPNVLTASVHNRMPVILKPSDYDRWLDTTETERPPVDLLRPYDPDLMTAHTVDPRVGNVRNNAPTLCEAFECPPNPA